MRQKGKNTTIDQVLAPSKLGGTPLEQAIRKGDLEAARFALAAGADPNQLAVSQIKINGLDGYTCLHMAAELGHAEIVKLLLEHHANRRAKTTNGKTPKDLAESKGHSDVPEAVRALTRSRTGRNRICVPFPRGVSSLVRAITISGFVRLVLFAGAIQGVSSSTLAQSSHENEARPTNALSSFPTTVQLPAVESTNEFPLGAIHMAAEVHLDVELLGGSSCYQVELTDEASPKEERRAFAELGSRREPIRTFEGIKTFSLTPVLESTDQRWRIRVYPAAKQVATIRFDVERSMLVFQWSPIARAFAASGYLQNCLLAVKASDSLETKRLRLRKPVSAYGARLAFADRSETTDYQLPHLPPAATMRLEISGTSRGFPAFRQEPVKDPIALPRGSRELKFGDGTPCRIRVTGVVTGKGVLRVITRAQLVLAIYPEPVPLSDVRVDAIRKYLVDGINKNKAIAHRLRKSKNSKQRINAVRNERRLSGVYKVLIGMESWRSGVGKNPLVKVKLYSVVDDLPALLLETH